MKVSDDFKKREAQKINMGALVDSSFLKEALVSGMSKNRPIGLLSSSCFISHYNLSK